VICHLNSPRPEQTDRSILRDQHPKQLAQRHVKDAINIPLGKLNDEADLPDDREAPLRRLRVVFSYWIVPKSRAELLHLLPGDAFGRFVGGPRIRRVVAVVENLGVAQYGGWRTRNLRAVDRFLGHQKAKNIRGTVN